MTVVRRVPRRVPADPDVARTMHVGPPNGRIKFSRLDVRDAARRFGRGIASEADLKLLSSLLIAAAGYE